MGHGALFLFSPHREVTSNQYKVILSDYIYCIRKHILYGRNELFHDDHAFGICRTAIQSKHVGVDNSSSCCLCEQ